MSDSKNYVIRKESSRANTYGLGEQVVPRVHLFRAGCYGLSKDELDTLIKSKSKKTIMVFHGGQS